MVKWSLLIAIILLSGCTFSREMSVRAGAKGANAKIYGQLDAGEMVYNSMTDFSLFCK